jgi:hypothetical protein
VKASIAEPSALGGVSILWATTGLLASSNVAPALRIAANDNQVRLACMTTLPFQKAPQRHFAGNVFSAGAEIE